MDDESVRNTIERKFTATSNPAQIALLRGHRSFLAELHEGGIEVSNLGTQPFLP